MARRGRRSTAIADFLQDIVDDIKDFIDDDVVDRSRKSERDLRRGARNVTDDEERRGRTSSSGRDEVTELSDVVRGLAAQIDALSSANRASASRAAVTEAEPAEPKAVAAAPTQSAPTQTAPAQKSPTPAKSAPVQTPPVRTAPVRTAPKPPAAKAAPAKPAAKTPAAKTPAAKVPAKPTAKAAPAKAAPAKAAATKAPARTTAKVTAQPAGDKEPWAGYDEQTVAEVRKALPGSSDALLERVRAYEIKHKNRRGVLDAADAEIGG